MVNIYPGQFLTLESRDWRTALLKLHSAGHVLLNCEALFLASDIKPCLLSPPSGDARTASGPHFLSKSGKDGDDAENEEEWRDDVTHRYDDVQTGRASSSSVVTAAQCLLGSDLGASARIFSEFCTCCLCVCSLGGRNPEHMSARETDSGSAGLRCGGFEIPGNAARNVIFVERIAQSICAR